MQPWDSETDRYDKAPFIDLPTDVATRGLQVFIEAQASLALASSTGLRQASFWIGFRQEFHMAYSQQRPFQIPLDICNDYLAWDMAPDHVQVNRLLIIAAHAVQYCYQDRDQQMYTYEEILSLHSRWLEKRPLSLYPVYSSEPEPAEGEIFPKKWFLLDCHILAAQSSGLIDILLTAYDPTVARVGAGQKAARERIDANLKAIVLDICGIAISNRQEVTAMLTACISIDICGDRFSDMKEQEALMDVVENSVRDNNYWASRALKEKLRTAWNWKT